MFLPHFDLLCNLLLNKRTATWNLFVLYNFYNLQLFTSKSFSITRKPTFAHTKKAIWRNLLSIKSEAISLVAMRNKELWLVKKNHATVKLDSNGFSWNENLQRKQNWTAKSTNIKVNAGKVNSVFVIRAALWGKNSLNVSLNIAGVEIIRSENMRLLSTLDAIWFEFPTVEICVVYG